MTRDSNDEPRPTTPAGKDTGAGAGEAAGGVAGEGVQPGIEHFDAALTHVDDSYTSGDMAAGAAKGILYSLIETLGTLVGDPDLPAHARSGYEGLLETARELRARIDQ
ncbi:hypothetical protein BGLT_04387 [Caballeronia glathei]|jgi:hypothetical protein|uniref:hypothetical protein n=1 Tax=Caballeronia glathei TaxID=60547 RepID=UPI0005066F9F|nr:MULTISPECIES: hypothetical protein [Burkholderiaceae]TCK43757.1 hypothetical protein B0G84_2099 [Paraburkholderia sp. BL8N3]CDY75488.1 hypothetical protein BGLT_04387 [Caballeronia glathei]